MTKINQTPSHIRNLVLKPWKHESHRRFWTSLVFTKKMVVFTKMPAFCLSLRSRIFFLIIRWHFPFVILTEKSKKTSHFNVDGNNFTVWKFDNFTATHNLRKIEVGDMIWKLSAKWNCRNRLNFKLIRTV